jgi:hypothetical protein
VSPAQRGGKGARKETQPRRRLERRIQNGHITDPDLLRDPSLALYEKRLVSVDMQKAVKTGPDRTARSLSAMAEHILSSIHYVSCSATLHTANP